MPDDYPLRDTRAEKQTKGFAAAAVRDLTGKSNSQIYQLTTAPAILSFVARSTEALRSNSQVRPYAPITVDTTQFQPSPIFAIGASQNSGDPPVPPETPKGLTLTAVACVIADDGSKSSMTLGWENGLLITSDPYP